MKLTPWLKNILSAFVIMAGGLALFTLAFLMTAFVTNAFIGVFGMERVGNPYGTGRWLTLLVILLLSGLVFRSKMNDTVKATFLTMPLMVVLVLTGIRFYQQPAWIIAGIGTVVVGAVLFYLHWKRLPWVYYFATFYVVALALYVLILGVDI